MFCKKKSLIFATRPKTAFQCSKQHHLERGFWIMSNLLDMKLIFSTSEKVMFEEDAHHVIYFTDHKLNFKDFLKILRRSSSESICQMDLLATHCNDQFTLKSSIKYSWLELSWDKWGSISTCKVSQLRNDCFLKKIRFDKETFCHCFIDFFLLVFLFF